MLDIHFVREHPDIVKASEKKRNRDPQLVDEVLAADERWRKMLKDVEKLKHQRNVVSEEINQAKKNKDEQNANAKIALMKDVAAQIKAKEEEVSTLLELRNSELLQLGNMMNPKVPYGKDDSQNPE